MILLAFQFGFFAYHSHLATWTHRLLILFELVAFFLTWPLALDAEKDFQWPNVGADIKRLLSMPVHMFGPMEMRHNGWVWLRERAISLSTCVLFVLVSLSIATFPGEPRVNLFTGKPLTSVQCERWLHQSFGFAYLRFDRLAPGSGYVVDDEKGSQDCKDHFREKVGAVVG